MSSIDRRSSSASDESDDRPPKLVLLLGVAMVFVAILSMDPPVGLDTSGHRALATLAAMVLCWVSGCLPLSLTALFPLILFPLLGILPSERVASLYASDMTFLFFGGFFLALTLQRWNLHRRIALHVLRIVGTRPPRLVLGFLVALSLLSMWISNTAAALMMLPIAIALIEQVEERVGVERARGFATALLLATAYGANIGGMGTPIGSPPNGIFLRYLSGTSTTISFAGWLTFGVPVAVVLILVTWVILTRVVARVPRTLGLDDPDFVRLRLTELGPLTREHVGVLTIFGSVIALWVLRDDLDLGSFEIPGWVQGLRRLGGPQLQASARTGIGDSAAAILGCLLLCTVRLRRGGRTLACWEQIREIPWGLLLLLGGGIALAEGFQVATPGGGATLSAWIAGHLTAVGSLPDFALILVVCLVVTFLTEVTSNTATASVMVPILAGVGHSETPHLAALAATLSASCAFMLPVATPPNALVFGSGRLRISSMIGAGLLLNLIGSVVITSIVSSLGRMALRH